MKIKLFANWTTSKELTEIWTHFLPRVKEQGWKSITLTLDPIEADYHVILNYPKDTDNYDPHKAIILYMEPKELQKIMYPLEWQFASSINGASKYIYLSSLQNNRMTTEWHLNLTYDQLSEMSPIKTKELSTITSGYQRLPGHKARYAFLKHLEEIKGFDFYGRDHSDSKCYKGPLPRVAKEGGLLQYKYHFAAENSAEDNYFTEKLIDGILCECLVFYWGCPNIRKFIDPRAYILIDINNPQEALKIIKTAIANDEYSKRIQYIKEAKRKILNELQIFPMVYSIITQIESDRKYFNDHVNTFCINLLRSEQRMNTCHEIFKHHGIEYHRVNAVDGTTLDTKELINSNIISPKMWDTKPGVLGIISSNIKVWRDISNLIEDKWNLILEDDFDLHPQFMSLVKDYLESIPQDAELVYFGCTSPIINGKNDQSSILPFCKPINKYIAQGVKTVQGAFAYAIKPATAKKLLSNLPLSNPIDYFDPDELKIYIMQRPDPLNVDASFYTNKSTWQGQHTILLHGLISVREENSTIGHVNHNKITIKPSIALVKELRGHNRLPEAFSVLNQVNEKSFEWYDEMSILAWHIEGQRFKGLQAFKDMIGNKQFLKQIIEHKERLITNLLWYEDSETLELLKKTFDHKDRKDRKDHKNQSDNKEIKRVTSTINKSKTIVTACDSGFFEACKTQIASVHRTSQVDQYLVYDLGLSIEEVKELNEYDKVQVRKLIEVGNVMSYAWKIAIFNELKNQQGLFLYLDSGAMVLESLDEIFEHIQSHNLFLVQDTSQFNYTWCHAKSVEIMKMTDEELEGFQLWAGIFGWYGNNQDAIEFINEAYKYSLIKDCVEGLKTCPIDPNDPDWSTSGTIGYGSYKGRPIRGHRHDQSILSILKERYCKRTWPLERYGAWQSLQYAIQTKSMIYCHRRTHRDFNGLKLKTLVNKDNSEIKTSNNHKSQNDDKANNQVSINILEIGLRDNKLSSDTNGKITCINKWSEDEYSQFITFGIDNLTAINGDIRKLLLDLYSKVLNNQNNKFDMIYINDAKDNIDHLYLAMTCFEMLKSDGTMVVYHNDSNKMVIEGFLSVYSGKYSLIKKSDRLDIIKN